MSDIMGLEDRLDELVARFAEIGENSMKDLPVYKHGLDVEPVAFVPWADGYLGMLITPWFLNLMYLPHERKSWAGTEIGHKIKMALPGGEHGLRVGEDDVVGRYLFISLASPMFKYDTQDMARLAAFSFRATYLDPPQDGEESKDAAPDPSEVLAGNTREIAGSLMDNNEDLKARTDAATEEESSALSRRNLIRGERSARA